MDSAAQQQPSYEANAYEILSRALNDLEFVQTLWPSPNDAGNRTLQEAGINSPEKREEFFEILNWAVRGERQLNEAMKEADEASRRQFALSAKASEHNFEQTMIVAGTMRDKLRETIVKIDKAYGQTMLMYNISFYMGVFLMAAAIVFAHYGKDLLTLMLGGMGSANTLTFFLTKPPERLQSSRASLAQLHCALYAWFTDFSSQNALGARLYQDQQNPAVPFDPKPFYELSNNLMKHTDDMLRMLQQYCKLVDISNDQSGSSSDASKSSTKPSPETHTATPK
jgi:hypothetical protein